MWWINRKWYNTFENDVLSIWRRYLLDNELVLIQYNNILIEHLKCLIAIVLVCICIALPSEVLEDMRSSQEKAQAAVLYHATQGRILTNKVKNNELYMSLDEENPLRLSVYRKAVGIESAIVEKADLEGQNGVIHIINRVVFPANISAGDLLRREGQYK